MVDEKDLIIFLHRIKDANNQLRFDILAAENNIQQRIAQATTLYSGILGTFGSIVTTYLLGQVDSVMSISQLVDEAIKDITPWLGSLLVKSTSVSSTSGGFFGFFATTSTVIRHELKATPAMIVEFLKYLGNPILSGLAGYLIHRSSQKAIHTFLEEKFTSPVDFISRFSTLEFDEQGRVARNFVLMRVRQNLIQNHFDIQRFTEEASLADFPQINQALAQFDQYINNHLRLIHTNKALMPDLEFKTFLQQYYSHFSLNPHRINNEPAAYTCPITLDLMQYPTRLIGRNGFIYNFEKTAIECWIDKNGTNPLTMEPVAITDLVPNLVLKAEIEAFTKEQDMMQEARYSSAMTSVC